MGRALLALGLILAGCKPASPPPPPAATPPAPTPKASALPPSGVLRLTSARKTPELESQFAPTPGLPALIVKFEYAGPNTWLRLETEYWLKGEKTPIGQGGQSLKPPISGTAGFGFKEAKPGMKLISSVPSHADPSDPGNSGRLGRITEYSDFPSFGDGRLLAYTPSWPLEIADGKTAVYWAVFLNEPSGASETASLEERSKRAEAALIFRIGTEDRKK